MRVVAFDGARVLLTEDRWKHIVQRHPELEDKQALVSNVISFPDEVYVDIGGVFHVLKKLQWSVRLCCGYLFC
jgi:ATP-dependent 26S proteasome regulatory subunit